MEFAKIVLSSLLSYAALFVCAKIIGRKQIAQLNFLDYITGITIGSIAAELATDLENMWKPLVSLGMYALLTYILSKIVMHSARSRKFLDGTPTIVMHNGKLCRSGMKKAKLDLSEFMVMCCEQGYFNLADIHTAVFEYNGKLTILPVSKKRSATPEDMKLSPKQETIFTEVIMDGRVLDENLQRMRLNAAWLTKQLRTQGVHNVRDVFLGLCDDRNRLTVYRMDA